MVNPALRDYRIPAFADVPRSEVYFADTYDKVGPLGAKAQGECAINAVAPAIANAVFDATGVRFADLPLTADRIFEKLGHIPEARGESKAKPAKRAARSARGSR
jgi:putative selenate reductase molybdopterin-binding subunit